MIKGIATLLLRSMAKLLLTLLEVGLAPREKIKLKIKISYLSGEITDNR